MYQNHINHKQNKRTLANIAKRGVELVCYVVLFMATYLSLVAMAV